MHAINKWRECKAVVKSQTGEMFHLTSWAWSAQELFDKGKRDFLNDTADKFSKLLKNNGMNF